MHFRWSLLSLHYFRRERSDDRKCVCFLQATEGRVLYLNFVVYCLYILFVWVCVFTTFALQIISVE